MVSRFSVNNWDLWGSQSPTTYPSIARVFRAGATRVGVSKRSPQRLHFIPAYAGISSRFACFHCLSRRSLGGDGRPVGPTGYRCISSGTTEKQHV